MEHLHIFLYNGALLSFCNSNESKQFYSYFRGFSALCCAKTPLHSPLLTVKDDLSTVFS